ncbi:hypothetical protein TELCIR_20279, partial [Teladorsagia circumcincta]
MVFSSCQMVAIFHLGIFYLLISVEVVKKIRGELEIDSVRLESILTDLYVSVMVQLIGVKQHHDSDRNQANKSKMSTKPLSPKRNTTMFDISLSGVAEGDKEEPLTTLRVTLGAIEGELPVAAHSLHD